MAALTRWLAAIIAAIGAMGCVDLPGLEAEPTPLARLNILVLGDEVASPDGADGSLFVMLRWGQEPRAPDPFCLLPAESAAAAAVIAVGCPDDSLGFVPGGPGERVDVTPGVATTLEVTSLPRGGDLVGDSHGRVAYGSLVVGKADSKAGASAYYYGASFFSMARPDQRLAYREGAFDGQSTFYPRIGCPPPPEGFSVLSAGGVSHDAAVAAALAGTLPAQRDPSSCRQESPDQSVITIRLQPARPFVEFLCHSSEAIYQPPSANLLSLPWACVSLPGNRAVNQLVVGFDDPGLAGCGFLHHYLLRGCHEDPTCAIPQWDQTASPPAWWPCPVAP